MATKIKEITRKNLKVADLKELLTNISDDAIVMSIESSHANTIIEFIENKYFCRLDKEAGTIEVCNVKDAPLYKYINEEILFRRNNLFSVKPEILRDFWSKMKNAYGTPIVKELRFNVKKKKEKK